MKLEAIIKSGVKEVPFRRKSWHGRITWTLRVDLENGCMFFRQHIEGMDRPLLASVGPEDITANDWEWENAR